MKSNTSILEFVISQLGLLMHTMRYGVTLNRRVCCAKRLWPLSLKVPGAVPWLAFKLLSAVVAWLCSSLVYAWMPPHRRSSNTSTRTSAHLDGSACNADELLAMVSAIGAYLRRHRSCIAAKCACGVCGSTTLRPQALSCLFRLPWRP